MGGLARAKSWVWAFQPPSGRSPPRLRAEARLRGPSLGPFANADARADTTLLTFDAVFPDTCQSVGPAGCPAELPLLGLSKDRPSVVLPTPESTPSAPSRVRLRDEPATAHPCSVPVVFHHLDGLLLRCRARVLQRAPDPGVHLVFGPTTASHPAATDPPRGAFPALRSFPSVRSCAFLPPPPRERGLVEIPARGSVTAVLPRRTPLSLPPHPFPRLPEPAPTVTRRFVSRSAR